MSRVKIEIDNELDFDLEEGDMIIHIKHNGEIGKVCMPDMNQKVKESIDARNHADGLRSVFYTREDVPARTFSAGVRILG